MIVLNQQDHGRAIAKAAGLIFHPEDDVSVSRVVAGKLLGGVIYREFTGVAVSLHMAGFGPFWANRVLVWAIFAYPFLQLKCKKLIAPVPSDRSKALAIVKKVGFSLVATVPDVFPDGHDLLVHQMLISECRWLTLRPSEIGDKDRG